MPNPHQIMVSHHHVPVIRETMLVLITKSFLHQKCVLYVPSMPGAKIAPFMKIKNIQLLTGQPCVTGRLGLGTTGLLVVLLPLLLADDNVHDLHRSFVIVVIYLVHPSERLPPICPFLFVMVSGLKIFQTIIFVPNTWKTFIL